MAARHDCNQVETIETLRINQATMATEIKAIKEKVNSIDTKLDQLPEKMKDVFVSKTEFEEHKINLKLVTRLVYSCVALILMAVVGAIIKLVVLK